MKTPGVNHLKVEQIYSLSFVSQAISLLCTIFPCEHKRSSLQKVLIFSQRQVSAESKARKTQLNQLLGKHLITAKSNVCNLGREQSGATLDSCSWFHKN
jgi:hypothetical protein